MELQAVAARLQRVLCRRGDAEDCGAENCTFDFPAAEDDDRERDEAASGGHILRESIREDEGEVRAAETGENRLDSQRGPAVQGNGMVRRQHGLRILAARS